MSHQITKNGSNHNDWSLFCWAIVAVCSSKWRFVTLQRMYVLVITHVLVILLATGLAWTAILWKQPQAPANGGGLGFDRAIAMNDASLRGQEKILPLTSLSLIKTPCIIGSSHRKYFLSVLCFAMLVGVVGCTEEKKEVKTVQWYSEHPEEQNKQVQMCRDNPGELKDDPNCINALAARAKTAAGTMRDKKWDIDFSKKEQ